MQRIKFIRIFLSSFIVCLMLGISAVSNAIAATPGETAVFAGGCFWGVDAVFRHVRGVSEVVSGYSGGDATTANYARVSTGTTGHAESVRIRFDPARVSYQQLLNLFFTVAHDPTQLDRQGPDVGSQYRSVIFYSSPEQQKAATDFIRRLTLQHAYSSPIVTQVVPLKQFYPAEQYHQNYLALHSDQPYIVINDLPKLKKLREKFPALYK
jgi:peptide-methionine (S)-S-oxide reductase